MSGAPAFAQLGVPRPDFILSAKPPKQGNRFPKAWLIGDVKASTRTFYDSYLKPGTQRDQFEAILNYARRHTYSRTSLFIVATHNEKKGIKAIKAEVEAQAIKNGTIALIVIVLGK